MNEKKRLHDKIRRQLKKIKVFHLYGDRCNCCGLSDWRFLSLDHIKNDGHIERKKGRPGGSEGMYNALLRKKRNDLQLLCFNCNVAKNINGGLCPHKEF